MGQEQHKHQHLETAVSQCMMLCSLQEKLDYSKQKRNIEENRDHNLQVHKKMFAFQFYLATQFSTQIIYVILQVTMMTNSYAYYYKL
jgi:hypothetical protein